MQALSNIGLLAIWHGERAKVRLLTAGEALVYGETGAVEEQA
jgi:hypothetical protein